MSVESTQQVDQVVISCRDQGRPVSCGWPATSARRGRHASLGLPPTSSLRSAGAAPTSEYHNTRWCTGLNFCGRRNRVPRADDVAPPREVTSGTPGASVNFADIANINIDRTGPPCAPGHRIGTSLCGRRLAVMTYPLPPDRPRSRPAMRPSYLLRFRRLLRRKGRGVPARA